MVMNRSGHYSVLLQEAVNALITDASGNYVDGTFGRGGHSREVLKRISNQGKLMAFDKDPNACSMGNTLSAEDKRFEMVHGSFTQIRKECESRNLMQKVAGVMLDLGVSSPQLDEADRGFSFLKDGPLDMRMDNSEGLTAAQWVATATEEEMTKIFRDYGEERFARRIAKAIVEQRLQAPITTTLRLAQIVSDANPKWEKGKHPATRVFQAIRIYINNELDDLQQVLEQSLDVLKVGGRLVVISFHSLEDRIVKRFVKEQERGRELPKNIPITDEMLQRKLKSIGRAIKATGEEVNENVRSRSAIMRIAERI